jgi:ADP-ribose pyrophosphatase
MSHAKPSVVFSGRYLDVIWEDGVEYTHNRRSRGVVLIIPATVSDEIVFLEQYRVPLKSAVIEFPAGLVGDEEPLANESFETAARRELLEESGYQAGELEFVLRGPASPGSSTEMVSFYLARDARKVHDGPAPGHERMHVHAVMLNEADMWLYEKMRSGVLVDPRVYLGVDLARKRRERK